MKTSSSAKMGTHHIAITASDFDRSCRFYVDGLGMKTVAAWGSGDQRATLLDIGDGTCIELFAGGRPEDTPQEESKLGLIHLAFDVPSPDLSFQRALEFGAQPRTEPTDIALDAQPEPLSLRIAFVYGPDREVLEFFHKK